MKKEKHQKVNPSLEVLPVCLAFAILYDQFTIVAFLERGAILFHSRSLF